MCGIAGILNFKTPEDKIPLLSSMLASLQHRGPDSAGIFTQGPAGLGSVRLSIIDLSGGNQPIHNEDKSIWLVFNGEIFNYPELRTLLISMGHQFYTQTDTEVLVHLYESFGTGMFAHLNGQFAFALWDTRTRALLLGRDRLGIRPLFYHLHHQRLIFGSEIKALFADKTISRELDSQSLSDIFCCWAPVGKATAFKNIFQLPPGHYARFSSQGLSIHQYWEIPGPVQETKKSTDQWVEELNELIIDAVRIRLRADVPVAAYLSGGLDSTYITALVKRHFNNRLKTFSVGFSDPAYDESHFQKKAVNFLGTDHQETSCSHGDIGEIFPEVIFHAETPLLRTAPAPLMHLARQVKRSGLKVILTGEGADEIFAGYNIFKEDKVLRFWAKFPESQIRPRLLEKLYPYIFSQNNARATKYLETFFKKGMDHLDSPTASHRTRWENTSHTHTFFSKDFLSTPFNLEHFIQRFIPFLPDGFMARDPLSRAQYIEQKTFLPNYLLSSQGDRMSMAGSIEGRYPFLDHRVVEFAATLPPHLKINGMTEKYILKKAAGNKVPRKIINRPKQPYRAPISPAFLGTPRQEYVRLLLSETAMNETGYFDFKKTTRLVEKCRHQNGALLSERENMALVGILSTQLLHDLFIRHQPQKNQISSQKITITQNKETPVHVPHTQGNHSKIHCG